MDSTNNTFTLDELDAEFWESALFVKVQHSSGLGGWVSDGTLWEVLTAL